jgi:hypothetical protein
MKPINVLVLLMLFQAVPPVPRKAIGNPGGSTNDINKDGKTNNAVSPSKAVENPVPAVSTQDKGNNAAREEELRHIVVDHLPGKDSWDKVYICLTAALVIIGGFTLIAIWIQAKETAKSAQAAADSVMAIQKQTLILERQAKASEDAAQASRKTAESIIKIERAWIDVYLKRVGPAEYQMEVTNCGRAVAQIKEYSLIPKLSAPEEKISAPYNFEHSTTVYCSKLLEPRDELWIAAKLNLAEHLGKEDFATVWSNNRGLAYYGIMRYNDTAGEPHETEFCYYFNASQGSRYLERVQAAEYNKHT